MQRWNSQLKTCCKFSSVLSSPNYFLGLVLESGGSAYQCHPWGYHQESTFQGTVLRRSLHPSRWRGQTSPPQKLWRRHPPKCEDSDMTIWVRNRCLVKSIPNMIRLGESGGLGWNRFSIETLIPKMTWPSNNAFNFNPKQCHGKMASNFASRMCIPFSSRRHCHEKTFH